VPEPFRHRLRVRFNECDPQGVVFYANYLILFDVAMTEFWREAIGGYDGLNADGMDAMVAETTIRYSAPARFDDELVFECRVTRLGSTSTDTTIEVVRGSDGERIVEGELRHVFVDSRTLAKREIPAHARAGLARYEAAG